MKKRAGVKIEGALGAEALRVLRDVHGFAAVSRHYGGKREPDAALRFGDSTVVIELKYRQRINAGSAWLMVHQAQKPDHAPLVVIAAESTTEARRILRDNGVSIIDGLGNAHLELPGLLIHHDASPSRRQDTAARTRLSGRAGVAAQALLLDPDRAWGVSHLAERADISIGLAHRVLSRLETEGIVSSEGRGPSRVRRVADKTALLDLWAEEQAERAQRTLGYVLAPSSAQLTEQVGTALNQAGIDYAITGAAAASLVAPFTTSMPVLELWVAATTAPDELYESTGADPVTEGPNVVFLRANDDAPLAFRERWNTVWLTNRFRTYRDLLDDPRRGREQARQLREETIGW